MRHKGSSFARLDLNSPQLPIKEGQALPLNRIQLVEFTEERLHRSLGKVGLLFTIPIVVALGCYMAYQLEILDPNSETLVIGLQKIAMITASMCYVLAALRKAQKATAGEE